MQETVEPTALTARLDEEQMLLGLGRREASCITQERLDPLGEIGSRAKLAAELRLIWAGTRGNHD